MIEPRWLACASRYGGFAAVVGLSALSACRRERGNGERLAAVVERDAEGDVFSSTSASDSARLVPAARRACRVMTLGGSVELEPRSLDGDVRILPPSNDSGAADDGSIASGATQTDVARPHQLAPGDLVPEGELLVFGPSSELTVQVTTSTREITLRGARAEVCPGGEEAVRLTFGEITAFPGAGVRPGADVWIATPLGVVRYNDAKIVVVVAKDASELSVSVITGQATFMPAVGAVMEAPLAALVGDGATAHPGATSDGRDDSRKPSPSAARDASATAPTTASGDVVALGARTLVHRREEALARWVGDLVADCLRQAKAAQRAGELVTTSRDAGRAALADLTFAHVRARQRARAACEVAWAADGLAGDRARQADLKTAEATWNGAPAPHP